MILIVNGAELRSLTCALRRRGEAMRASALLKHEVRIAADDEEEAPAPFRYDDRLTWPPEVLGSTPS